MSSFGNMAVILNTGSGQDEKDTFVEKLPLVFAKHGLKVDLFCGSGQDLIEKITNALNSQAKIIIAAGGDGTVNSVAAKICGTEKILGVLPLGTLNHFAKDLAIPLSIEESIRTIATGRVMQIDMAEVNGEKFINNSSLGLYPLIVRQREVRQKQGQSKWSAFVRAAAVILKRFPRYYVRMNVEGKKLACVTPLVFIGNNIYDIAAWSMGTRKRLDQGLLSVYMIRNGTRSKIFALCFKALAGQAEKDPQFEIYTASEVWIESPHPVLSVSFDGEVKSLKPPLHYRSLPKTLNVIVPREDFKKS